jgi:hypothetical protein
VDRPAWTNRRHSCGLLLGYFFSMLSEIIADIAVIEELEKWANRLRLRTIIGITGS